MSGADGVCDAPMSWVFAIVEAMHAADMRQAAQPSGTPVAVYTDHDLLPVALTAAARSNIAVIIRDRSEATRIRESLGPRRRTTVVVDPGYWRHRQGTARQPLELPLDGLFSGEGRRRRVELARWAREYLQSSGADALFTPSRFVDGGDWATLRALRRQLLIGLSAADRIIGLIPTHARMLDPSMVSQFCTELEPLADLPLGFVFAGGREALARNNRVSGLQKLLGEFRGAWLLGVDALIATDALGAGAAMVGIGIRSGMRWPAAPGRTSNAGFARGGVPGRFHRDLLTYRSPLTYGDWYLDSVPSSCRICGKQPYEYVPRPEAYHQIHEHNVHAATSWCAELLDVDGASRLDWLNRERVEAADRYHELSHSRADVIIDPTLVALVRRDNPGWRAPIASAS